MNLQTLQSTNMITFTGKTRKTPRGNEYPVTHMARNSAGAVGLLSGALAAKIALKPLKNKYAVKKEFITSINDMSKSLSFFGKVGERGQIKKGLTALVCVAGALGMFVGAAIGGTIDSHNNHKRAKAADKNH